MNRIRLLSVSVCLVAAFACGTPETTADAGNEPEDSGLVGQDAGVPDAGMPDAGLPDAGPMDAGFGPISIADWCDVRALARCARLSRCLSLDVEQDGECLKREKLACDQNALSRGVNEGRLQYLPQQAADCINAYASVTCTEEPSECDAVFSGLVAPDGGCLTTGECEGGSYCYVYDNKCPYSCFAYRKVGEACDWSHNQCDPQEAACQTVNGSNQCVAKLGLGSTCIYWSDCQDGLACIDQVCVQYEATLGESCGTSGSFYYPTCTGDTFCRQPHGKDGTPTDGGVCMQRAAMGGVCTGYNSCETGLRCSSNYTTGTCIPLGRAGDTCTNYYDCQSELYCAPSTSRCTPFPKDGGDCSSQGSSYRCAPGYYCDFNSDTCYGLQPMGQPCSYDGVCQSNTCDYGTLPDGGAGFVCSLPCSVTADGGF